MTAFYLLSENDKDMTERREKSSPYSLLLQKYQTLRHLNPVYILKTFKFNNDAKFYAKLSEWGTQKIQSNLTSSFKKQVNAGRKNTNVLSIHCKIFKEQVLMLVYKVDSSVQFSSVAQLCPTLCDPMNRSTPDLPVYHQLLEFTQAHVHWVGDAIQPSHPLSSPSPPVFNLSQHQGLFKWVNSSYKVTKILGVSASTSILPMNTQDWSPLGWTGWISLQSKGLSRVFSNTTVQKHQFFCAQLSL